MIEYIIFYSITQQQQQQQLEIKMPSKKSTRNNAKKSACAEGVLERLDSAGIHFQRKMTEKFVIPQIMPALEKEANDNFDKKTATALLKIMREKVIDYFISKKWWHDHGKAIAVSYNHGHECLYLGNEERETLVVAHLTPEPKTKMFIRKDCEKELFDHVADRRKSATRKETYFTYHNQLRTGTWGTNEDLRIEMKNWKQQKKNGILNINEKNKNSFEINGKTYYTLTITELDEDGEHKKIGIDRFGFGMGHIVDGIMYWFVSEENRDAVVKYVME